MRDSAALAADAVVAVSRIDSVPTLLKVLCEMTRMRYAAVVAVIGDRWTPCAVMDDVPLGIGPGDRVPLRDALCSTWQEADAALVIEHASRDPRYRAHPMTLRHGVESYVSVPIVLAGGRRFGRLCALDVRATPLGGTQIGSMFQHFAALIAARLDDQRRQQLEHAALLDERAASELREQFIAILGHDLRNPLQAIFAGSEVLERRTQEADLRIHATRIRTNARRMSLLIDDVLDFARGRLGGGIGLELTDTDNINAGLATVIQELRDGQPGRQIVAAIEVDRPVRCDLGRLQQVASNLLGNALTHGDPHTAVRIAAYADERDLVLEVWNAGEPIPSESIGKIFEPFWRHSVSASRNGLGLGLHICSQIIRAHCGTIAVASTQDGGTRFTARLPLGDAVGTAPAMLSRGGTVNLT